MLAVSAAAQPAGFVRGDTVRVYNGANQLSWPWAGGHNFCQISDIDLNQDGIMDLFIFDRTGNRITTFINHGTANQVDYELAPEYERQFPPLHDWVLLRDYNCDGKTDIFAYTVSGFGVWKNISTASSGLQFQQVSPLVYSDYNPNGNPQMINLYVSPADIPGIRDIDGDGDLDVVTYSILGNNVEYHRNLSEEEYGTCDSLKFEIETYCWGEFSESGVDATITLNQTCPPPLAPTPENIAAFHIMHAGSCIECLNIDGDNDMDAAIGDITYNHMTMVRNGGNNTYAVMDSIDPLYPSYTNPVTMNVFLCGFHVDVDNDGKKDFLSSPNAGNASENTRSMWFYHNTGRTDSSMFNYVQNDFIQDNEIEVGEGNYPVFYDYNNDGRTDLLVADYGYYNNSNGTYQSKIALYKNTGSLAAPQFTFQTNDFANIFSSNYGLLNMPPTFGDLDNDGDKDMIVGAADGHVHYFQNNSGNFVFAGPNYQGIDVGNFSAPQLIDLNRDGKLDLVVGEQSGNLDYYQNTGTVSSPTFTLTTQTLGNVDVRQTGWTTGYSTPFIFDVNGSYKMIVGTEQGWLHLYDNIDNNLSGTFNEVDSMYQDIWEGSRTYVNGADINSDGLLDLVIGNYSGGTALFLGDNNISTEQGNMDRPAEFSMYPNPAQNSVTIALPEATTGENHPVLSIFDGTGRLVLEQTLTTQRTLIGTSQFSAGMYVCALRNGNNISHRKLMINR